MKTISKFALAFFLAVSPAFADPIAEPNHKLGFQEKDSIYLSAPFTFCFNDGVQMDAEIIYGTNYESWDRTAKELADPSFPRVESHGKNEFYRSLTPREQYYIKQHLDEDMKKLVSGHGHSSVFHIDAPYSPFRNADTLQDHWAKVGPLMEESLKPIINEYAITHGWNEYSFDMDSFEIPETPSLCL